MALASYTTNQCSIFGFLASVQISNQLTALPSPQTLRQRNENAPAEDLRRPQANSEEAVDVADRPQAAPASAEPEGAEPERVEASREVDRVDFQARDEQSDLPFHSQQALQAFQENTPSVEQRLGVELVGVDTYA